MDDREMIDQQTCQSNLHHFFKKFCKGIASYLQCDQQFATMEIIPYEAYFIKDEQTLLSNPSADFQNIHRETPPEILFQHDEIGRWSQLSTWQWWKTWLCCNSDKNTWLEEDYHYDDIQQKVMQANKDRRSYSNNNLQQFSQKQNSKQGKQIIVYKDQQELQKQGKNLNSLFYEFKNQNTSELKPIFQKVNARNSNSITNIGIKRRIKKEDKKKQDQININHTNYNQVSDDVGNLQNPLNSQQPIQSVAEVLQKPIPSPISMFPTNVDNLQNMNNKQDNTPNKANQKTNRSQVRNRDTLTNNVKDEFSQLQINLLTKQQKPLIHSKTTVIQPKLTSSNFQKYEEESSLGKINYSEAILIDQNPSFFKQKSQNNFDQSMQKSESYFDHQTSKRKKKRMNLFQEGNRDNDLQVKEQQPPEDTSKKRRRRRRKTIQNQEKEQQERASKRQQQQMQKQKEELQIIIYSQNQDD